MIDESGTLETKKDEPGPQGIVDRWLKELSLAEKREKEWRDDAQKAVDIYVNKKKSKETFNILWANVETKRPALYNSLPEVDIRRRFRDKDTIGKAVSELLERTCEYIIDCSDLDFYSIQAVNDMLISGRAVTEIVYEPEFEEYEEDEVSETGEVSTVSRKELVYQDIKFSQTAWDDFRVGPGNNWKEVPWLAFRYKFTKDEIRSKWPKFKDELAFNDDDKEDKSVFKRVPVWKIWDKDAREVIWVCEEYKDSPLDVESDPLELKDFFPVPRPLYAVENPTSTVPICEFAQYFNLAKELEEISRRINKIIKAVRYRGVYDSTLAEMQKLFDSDDNEFIPSEDTTRLISEKGIQSAIWTMPVREIAEALVILKNQRRDLVQEIYEVTGISDIMRGATNPHETKGAQEIKANFGSGRLARQQTAVQVYMRDIIRIIAEIAAENFTRETFTRMTGLNFPTQMDKMLAQFQMEQAQQEPPPELQEMLSQPTWEEIEEVMKNDFLRSYRVDIETDSTIKLDEQKDKQHTAEMMKAIADFSGAAGMAVQAGALPEGAPSKLIAVMVRKFKLGREVEEFFNQPPQPKQDPEAMKLQQEQQQAQMEAQMEQQKFQMEMQGKQQELQIELQKAQMELRMEQEKMQLERQKMQMELENARMKQVIEQQGLVMKNEFAEEQHKRKMDERTQRNTQ